MGLPFLEVVKDLLSAAKSLLSVMFWTMKQFPIVQCPTVLVTKIKHEDLHGSFILQCIRVVR